MSRWIGLIGVPSIAGAHWPGQEKAPRVIAGLVERLRAAGMTVIDHCDMPCSRWYPDREHRRPHNLAAVVEVARGVADLVEAALQDSETPLVIGGDCTIELGVLSGFLRRNVDVELLYFDGGVDLRTPLDNPTGILDSMGVAYILGEPGSAEEFARIGPRFPLMPTEKLVLFGYSRNEPEVEVLSRRSMPRYPVGRVREGSEKAAAETVAYLEEVAGRFVVHFDVDVNDFVDMPVADVLQHNAGLTFREALACLGVFASSPKCAGLVVTELNPDHADEAGETVTVFVQGLVDAVTASKARSFGPGDLATPEYLEGA